MLRRFLFWFVIVGAIAFAVQGGEYSSMDLWRQRQMKQRLIAQTDSLERVVDSLRKWSDLIGNDPATQERIAREQFGMVRGDREILYRMGDPES